MSKAFEVQSVTKSFGTVYALNGLTFSSDEGKVFGLLGPNGAGKTTIIRILSTLAMPDKGTVKVCGVDVVKEPQRVREIIGLAGQYAALDAFQTGRENIFMTGLLYGLVRAEAKRRTQELLERLELTDAADRQVGTYSGGMRRRLDLGACLICRPKVLFLDEPTTGLDPKSRLAIWELVRELVKEGTSVLLTTQYLEEADRLADSIAVIGRGQVIAEGTSAQLKALFGDDVITFGLLDVANKAAALEAIAPSAKHPPTYDETTLEVRVPVNDGSEGLMNIASTLGSKGLRVAALSLHEASLDDVFLALTGTLPAPETNGHSQPKGHGHGKHGK